MINSLYKKCLIIATMESKRKEPQRKPEYAKLGI